VEREMSNGKIRDIVSELKSHIEKPEETVIYMLGSWPTGRHFPALARRNENKM
jgi:hypothetical protein